jgi:hypothetical protein
VSVKQYEALQLGTAARGCRGAGLGTGRGAGTGAEDLVLFAEVAAGRLSTDELRERVLSRYRR